MKFGLSMVVENIVKWKDRRLELTQLLNLLAVCIAAACCTVEHVAMKFIWRLEVGLVCRSREETCAVIFAFFSYYNESSICPVNSYYIALECLSLQFG
jgi:hypothetical protein